MCISFPPTLTMMHLCITQCTYWTPLHISILLASVLFNYCSSTKTRSSIHTCTVMYVAKILIKIPSSADSNTTMWMRISIIVNWKFTVHLTGLSEMCMKRDSADHESVSLAGAYPTTAVPKLFGMRTLLLLKPEPDKGKFLWRNRNRRG